MFSPMVAMRFVSSSPTDRPEPGIRHRLERFEIALGVQRQFRDGANERLEIGIAGDEIGLGIDLDDGARVVVDADRDEALGRHPARFFRGGGQTLLAQPIGGVFDIAVGLDQSFLAIHHAGAGLISQFLNQAGGNLTHLGPLYSRSR